MTVEIIGRACLVAGANSPHELFQLLRDGRSTVTEIPDDRWDKARYWHPDVGTPGKTYTFAAGVIESLLEFDPAVFGMSPREAESLDPQQRLLLRMAWRALEDANLTAERLQKQRVGVYVGASSLEYGNLIVGDPAAASPYFMTGNTLSVIANRISHVFGLHGPSMAVDTACSSGLVALDLALRALESGDIDTAIVGSVNVLAHPLSFVGFAQARMLAPYGQCRAYDNKAEGYVRAEGGAMFILRRTDRAAAAGDRSHARIITSAVNSAGRTNGISLPSREAQAALLRSIYTGGGIDPNRVAFVEGHGTGTRVGDPAEIWALGTEIGRHRRAALPVGSIKSNIGHTEPASGLLGLLKATLALEHNFLPASLHFDTPNDQIDFAGLNVSVAADPIELLPGRRARLAGVNSFGFGGTNVHVVISDPERATAPTDGAGQVLFVSAQSSTALKELLASYKAVLAAPPKGPSRGLVAAIGSNRHHMRHRFVLPSGSPKTIVQDIDAFLAGKDTALAETGEAIQDQAKTAFVFSGNGSQWAGMAIDAFRTNEQFRDRFKVVDALFKGTSQLDLHAALFGADLETRLADTRIAQPLLFATQVALADTLMELGLLPAVAYGHSIGEVAAAYVAGAISLVDAVSIVSKRSRHQHKVAGRGRMVAVAMGADEALALARGGGLDEISIAAMNSHNAATMSGPSDQIAAFHKLAGSKRIAGQILDIDYPFHHPLIDAARQDFLADLTSLSPRQTRIPFISTVTGDLLSGDALDKVYWWKNIREPVRFDMATAVAIREECRVFVEIGPRPILASYLRETLRLHDVRGVAVPTLTRAKVGPPEPVRKAFAKAVAVGAAFDVERTVGQRNAFVDLPPLPFAASIHRYNRTAEALDLYGDGSRDVHSLAGWRVDLAGNAWHNHVDARVHSDLAEHVVDGRPILPGSAFIDIFLAVARRFYGAAPFEITNVEILYPLDLSQSRLMELSTTLSPETGRIEIRSRERLKDEDWILHAVARARTYVVELGWNGLPDAVAESTVAATDAYETARCFGLDYGPCFQLLEKAVLHGDRHVEVFLARPKPPAHPYVEFELNPISTDAALHGLVGLFGRLATDGSATPYIPVHFGVVQLHRPGASVNRAEIVIERASSYSIRANLRLFGDDGLPVATLMDARLQRSHLKTHKDLGALSFHYDGVPHIEPAMVQLSLPQAAPQGGDLPGPAIEEEELEKADATLLLEAAVYRASYDLAGLALTGDKSALMRAADGDRDLVSYLTTCLQRLEQVGLSEEHSEGWRLSETCTLPAFDDILVQFMREAPGRSTEAVLLNDAYRVALDRTAAAQSDASPQEAQRKMMSDVTRDYVTSHSPASLARFARLADRFRERVAARAWQGLPLRHAVELGAASKGLSADLADIAGSSDLLLSIVEPRARLRKELELALVDTAHVSVVADISASLGTPDLIVSGSAELFGMLKDDQQAADLVRRCLSAGGLLELVVETPGLYSDFVFGLREGWFARTADPAFPVGKHAIDREWAAHLHSLGACVSDQKLVRVAGGNMLVISVEGRRVPDVPTQSRRELFVVASAGPLVSSGRDRPLPAKSIVALGGSVAEDRAAVAASLDQAKAKTLVYCAGLFGSLDEVQAVHDNVAVLGELVRELALRVTGFGKTLVRPRLVAFLPCGAPLAQARLEPVPNPLEVARNAAIWAFLRTARNEYPDVEIHSVDLAVDGSNLSEGLALASRLLRAGSANHEWVVDSASGAISEVRLVPGPARSRALVSAGYASASVKQEAASSISSLRWEAVPPTGVGPGEVCIEVAGTALNYRDVMWAIGLLPEEALEDGFAGPSIGMELSGTVLAVGEGVDRLAVGDRVMAVAANAFGTHVVTRAEGVARLPDSVSLVEGATLPVVFLTAYYALVELGRIRAGETVLVHGGAGGVGLAALQIAKACGATVIATAGTEEKRQLLTLLGADHVLDSRSLDFVADVRALTDHAGVDIVLNSLFGEAMERSLSLVKPFGRFLELGKRDYYADSKIGLRPFRRNVSYFGIDADQLLKSRPDVTSRMFGEIAALFDRGDLSPVAFRTFGANEIRDAFRLMQGSGHIGKIVVTPPVPGRDAVATAPVQRRLSHDGTYLVVGGTGGFGFELAGWLVRRGARRIALCSRRGQVDDRTSAVIRRWISSGIEVSVHACDAADPTALEALLDELRAKAQLRGIVHAAMVLDDALIVNLDRERNRPVIDAKARIAANLDRLTGEDELDLFLLFSSVTTAIGNPGQSNYVAGNGFLEGLARARRAAGRPALAAAFGAISDVGYLAGSEQTKAALAKRLGKFALTARDALDRLGDYLDIDPGTPAASVVVIAEINLRAAQSLEVVGSPLFSVPLRALAHQPASMAGDDIDLAALLEGRSAKEGEQIIFDFVAAEIAATLRVPVSEITRAKIIREIGMDSLMAMELGMNFQHKTGFDLPLSNLSDGTTVGDIAHKLYTRVATAADPAEPMPESAIVEQLVGRHTKQTEQRAASQ